MNGTFTYKTVTPHRLLTLPQVVQKKIFANTPFFDLANVFLFSKIATRHVSQFKFNFIPQLNVVCTTDEHNISSTIEVLDVSGDAIGKWIVNWRNNKRPIDMEYIGEHSVFVRLSDSSEIPTMNIYTQKVLPTTATIIQQIRTAFRQIKYSLTFKEMDLYGFQGMDHFIRGAHTIKMDQVTILPHHVPSIQKLFGENQLLYFEDENIEFTEPIEAMKIEINNSNSFNLDNCNLYKCEFLEVHESVIPMDGGREFIQQWMDGNDKKLMSFRLHNVDKAWTLLGLAAEKWYGGERFYRDIIDCSEGYDVIRKDGTVGTLNFTDDGGLLFLIWL